MNIREREREIMKEINITYKKCKNKTKLDK